MLRPCKLLYKAVSATIVSRLQNCADGESRSCSHSSDQQGVESTLEITREAKFCTGVIRLQNTKDHKRNSCNTYTPVESNFDILDEEVREKRDNAADSVGDTNGESRYEDTGIWDFF